MPKPQKKRSFENKIPSLKLKPGKDRRVRNGHLWVFNGEFQKIPRTLPAGGIVDVLDSHGVFLARGTLNQNPQIAFRVLTRNADEHIDETWFRKRIAAAVARREPYYAPSDPRRILFSEGDFLPGVIADQYNDVVILQLLTAGMDRFRGTIVKILSELPGVGGIHERSDASMRRHEGLEPKTGLLWGAVPEEIETVFDGLKVPLSVEKGHKTGLYLDQRFNRQVVRRFVKNARVLDVFANTGLFGFYALKNGAAQVTAVEMSPEMSQLCREGAKRNKLEKNYDVITANAFDVLRKKSGAGETYDLIILDPPAFTKSARAAEQALKGYKEINLRALKMLPPGGILITCTCSYHVSEEMFIETVRSAGTDAHCRTALLEIRGQSPDHPILLGVPETRYLTCLVLQKID